MKKEEEKIYEEEGMDLIEKEEEIIDSYEEEEEEYQEFKDVGVLEENSSKRITRILYIIVLICMTLVLIDIISVLHFNSGPFFAIKTNTYKDGGTREYYGVGYKVIKYHQIQGRRDMVLGFWNLAYNTTAITVQDLDLAIAFTEKEQETSRQYLKKFVRITSTLQEVDLKNNKLKLAYVDEDGKYTLNIMCDVVKDQTNLNTFETNKKITIIGTVKNYKERKLYVVNCFAEQ